MPRQIKPLSRNLNSTSCSRARISMAYFLIFLLIPAAYADLRKAVDLELVLAVDTSGSVDDREYELQMEGIVRGFRDPAVIAAIYGTGQTGIAVTLVHWSSTGEYRQVVPWMQVNSRETAHDFSNAVAGAGKRHFNDSTGIGAVLRYGERLIRRNRFDGRRRSIDVSGDGINNSGIPPEIIRDAVVAAGVTINGLTILNDQPHLHLYYARNVIGGSGAFVMTVESYEDIIAGMRAKLLREISVSVAVGPLIQRPEQRSGQQHDKALEKPAGRFDMGKLGG